MTRSRTRRVPRAAIAGGVSIAATAALLVAAVAVSTPAPTLPAGGYVVAFGSPVDAGHLVDALHLAPSSVFASAVYGAHVELTSRQATALFADGRVTGLSIDRTVVGASQTVGPIIGATEASGAPVNAGDGVGTWDGPAVAVIDSGVWAHSDINLK